MKKVAIGAGIAAFIIVGFVYYMKLMEQRSKAAMATVEAERQTILLQSMTPEQRLTVNEYFRHAGAFYAEGKFALCLASLKDMKTFLHIYKNSQELEANCEKGLKEPQATADTKDTADEPDGEPDED
jgi:hypothetical protein